MEKVISIPREMIKNGGVVIIPREEYEEFSHWKAFIRAFRVFEPTRGQKRDLKNARSDYKKNKYLNLNEFRNKLEG